MYTPKLGKVLLRAPLPGLELKDVTEEKGSNKKQDK